jgi:predicted DNA-binding transcriptional regulator AlpA
MDVVGLMCFLAMVAADPPEPLWTVADVAAYLSKTSKAIHHAVQRGQVPGVVRLGKRSLRFDGEVIRAWISRGGAFNRESGRRDRRA